MGIDIRDGLQLECIGCGLCVDACNDVMAKVGRPPELITLDTERNQALRAEGAPLVRRFVRPRTVIYAAILVLISAGTMIGLSARAAVDVNVLHDRNPLFVRLSDGSIQNGYTVKILNKIRDPRTYELSLEGLRGATLAVVGQERDGAARVELAAKPDAVTTYRVHVSARPDAVDGEAADLTMILRDRASGEAARHQTVFRGPA
jgi:polyferredoxin